MYIADSIHSPAPGTLSVTGCTRCFGKRNSALIADVVQQQSILKDVEAMTIEKGAAASTFDKIVSTLKTAGHIAELIEPLKAVAWAFGLPAPL